MDISTPGRVHPDVVEFDAASNGQKEQIKELASRAQMAPQRGSHRVYIIDEAHGLSLGGGQAFLKLLEEPPAHVIFMLATTDPDKMLRTNRGRCVEFELTRPTEDELAEHLQKVAQKEGWSLSKEAAQAVVQTTDPALGLRGLLMTLGKLTETLEHDGDVDTKELTMLLGLPPAEQMRGLLDGIDAFDRAAALEALTAARQGVSDEAIRRALQSEMRTRLFENPSPRTAWVYEQVVDTQPGPLWTEILICRIASPALDPTVQALTAHQEEAATQLESLTAALKLAAEKAPQPQTAPVAVAPEVSSPSPTKEAESDTSAIKALEDELLKQGAKTALAAFRACKPTESGKRVVLHPSEKLRPRLNDVSSVLKSAASACGVTLSIKKS
jgi:DNA polymerase III gamma/tau subunit